MLLFFFHLSLYFLFFLFFVFFVFLLLLPIESEVLTRAPVAKVLAVILEAPRPGRHI